MPMFFAICAINDRARPVPTDDLHVTEVVVDHVVVEQAVRPICMLGVTSTP